MKDFFNSFFYALYQITIGCLCFLQAVYYMIPPGANISPIELVVFYTAKSMKIIERDCFYYSEFLNLIDKNRRG